MWGARDSLEALKPHHKSDKDKDVISLVFSSKKNRRLFQNHIKNIEAAPDSADRVDQWGHPCVIGSHKECILASAWFVKIMTGDIPTMVIT